MRAAAAAAAHGRALGGIKGPPVQCRVVGEEGCSPGRPPTGLGTFFLLFFFSILFLSIRLFMMPFVGACAAQKVWRVTRIVNRQGCRRKLRMRLATVAFWAFRCRASCGLVVVCHTIRGESIRSRAIPTAEGRGSLHPPNWRGNAAHRKMMTLSWYLLLTPTLT